MTQLMRTLLLFLLLISLATLLGIVMFWFELSQARGPHGPLSSPLDSTAHQSDDPVPSGEDQNTADLVPIFYPFARYLATQALNSSSDVLLLGSSRQNDTASGLSSATPSSFVAACRTTRPGALLVCDDRGVLCSPFDRSKDGCCPLASSQRFVFERYDCRFCHLIQENFFACSYYEPCVSCCMNPRNLLLRTRSKRIAASNPGYGWLGELDSFDYCSFACLTNSHSVHHDKNYRFPVFPYGFGELVV
mmetsp:Transcript_23548/g.58958  ORF Transcript_23548/g.58958 Transcript_23548/m.58958 type:complete len:248 (-) Transcript_23548:127-870(-)|eukprot:CAMPEP_0174234946 /NCGR_PEP_ID=MMETSP0417-20130205/4552_1 /TAXON_ID=242541 /ORGANISM="Mayorella sp, Strain BSH-02190019" /LENGTH=247 /DNA_ID=CAMNT_0015313377 /DNA_START=53 /DNA_END=796 /DNA_ORIENTATION=+